MPFKPPVDEQPLVLKEVAGIDALSSHSGHELGIHASPTCVISFGGKGGCRPILSRAVRSGGARP